MHSYGGQFEFHSTFYHFSRFSFCFLPQAHPDSKQKTGCVMMSFTIQTQPHVRSNFVSCIPPRNSKECMLGLIISTDEIFILIFNQWQYQLIFPSQFGRLLLDRAIINIFVWKDFRFVFLDLPVQRSF